MADRSYGSDDWQSEHEGGLRDAAIDAHGYHCPNCRFVTDSEDEISKHNCEDDREPADEDLPQADLDYLSDREADRWEKAYWND